MNKLTLVTIVASTLIGACVTHFYYQSEIKEYKLLKEQEYSQALEEKIEENQQLRQRVYDVESNYLKQKSEYEKTIADMRSNYTISGLFDCSRDGQCLPRTDGSTSEFVCYRTGELRQRVDSTMVIGQRCDNLAMKYNALLTIVKEANGQ